MEKYVSRDECNQCRQVNQAKRETLLEKIDGVEKRTNILIGTTTITILLMAIELITRAAIH